MTQPALRAVAVEGLAVGTTRLCFIKGFVSLVLAKDQCLAYLLLVLVLHLLRYVASQ